MVGLGSIVGLGSLLAELPMRWVSALHYPPWLKPKEEQMRRLTVGSLVLGCSLAVPGVATAQEPRVPAAGSAAVGIDAGAFVPTADSLNNSMLTNVLYEYYVTPRVSLRTDFGWATPALKGGSNSLRQVPLRLDVNYNWEGGKWHPFVGTGVGAYFLQARNSLGSLGDTDTKLGINFGGGVEYFLHRNVSLKGEGRYHAVNDAFGQDPSGTALTAGLKTYF
jgi:opacity protein-like surface antigen